MSFYVDRMFAQRIAHRLPLSVWKSSDILNFRCVLCGDSKKSSIKKRGFIMKAAKDDRMKYFCHNCGAAMWFSVFLKSFDPALWSEYIVEVFGDKKGSYVPEKEIEVAHEIPNKFNHATPVIKLPDTHIAKTYLKNRMITMEMYQDFLYTEDIRQFVEDDLKMDKKVPKGSFIILPYRNENGTVFGYTARAVSTDSSVRYVKIRIDESRRMIYGLDRVDKNRIINVLEGEIDSLFVKNAVATGGINQFMGIEDFLDVWKEKVRLVIDREPRSKEIVPYTEKLIDAGYTVVLFPDTLPGKDVNDFIRGGIDAAEVNHLIEAHAFKGLEAKMEMMRWKKIN